MLHLYLLLLPGLVSGNPVGDAEDIRIDSLGLDFLSERGYIKVNSDIGEIVALPKVVKALKKFQEFAGIEMSGVFDEKTREFMQRPRCGRPDVETTDEAIKRRKRFTPQGTIWKKRLLTWALEGEKNNDGISNFDVRRVFRLSLNKWQAVTNIDFVELVGHPDDSADIRVLFGTGKHAGCSYAFDGKGNTLAHAFYPLNNYGLSGDVHFDDDEDFTIQKDAPRGQMKLFWITVHELGHSPGLAHSNKRGAIMYPYYQHVNGADFNLTDDDIRGIQSIYGEKTTPQQKTTLAPTITAKPKSTAIPKKECTNVIQAAYIDDKWQLNIFNHNQHYVLDDARGGVARGPAHVGYHFENVKFVDTVFIRHTDRHRVVFHGHTFSVYDNAGRRVDAPRKITDGFQFLSRDVTTVDAALVWPENDKLYIFIGNDYWKMTQLASLDYIADYGYPKKISANWIGLPSSIDAAFEWVNKQVYFTKGRDYYRWNKYAGEVNSGYPQKLTRSFLKCHK